jgi:hypothetical protein
MDRLISKASFARLCGVKPSSVSIACKKFSDGGIVDGRVNLENETVISYVSKHTGKPPPENFTDDNSYAFGKNSGAPLKGNNLNQEKEKKQSLDNLENKLKEGELTNPKSSNDQENVSFYMNFTLEEIVDNFGTDQSFCHWLRAAKLIRDIDEKTIKNEMLVGTLVNRDLVVKGVIDPMNSMCTRILTDGSKTIARRALAMSKVGAEFDEVEAAVYDLLSSLIKPAIDKAERSVRNV